MRYWRIFGGLALSLSSAIVSGTPSTAMDFTAPAVDSSSFTSSIANTASYFGISEVRIGPAFSNLELMPQLWFVPDGESLNKARLDSVQFDVLFKSPLPDVPVLSMIRPSVGAMINLGGYESVLHAGIDAHVPIGDSPFYIEGGIGAGIHNGYIDNAPPGFHNLGCRTLIHWEYGVGANLNQNVTATIQWQHVSDVFQCKPNDGLNEIGLLVGWKF